MERHHPSTCDVWKPCQPSAAHGVTQMQGFERTITYKAIDPSDLSSAEFVGFGIVFEYQHALPALPTGFDCDSLMRFIATSDRINAGLSYEELHLIGNERGYHLVEELSPISTRR